jgi:hypothetical protein
VEEKLKKFLVEVRYIITKRNHCFKFDNAYQIEAIINDCCFIKELDLKISYNDGYWTFTGNPDDINRLDEVITIFKILYRFHALEYFGTKPTDDKQDELLLKSFDFIGD